MTKDVATSIEQLTNISIDTPDGEFHIIIDKDQIARASGFGDITELADRLSEELRGATIKPTDNHPYEAHVKAYYTGDKTALDNIPRDQNGTKFQKKVWQAISNIPYGKTVSYKELANASGNPAAIRAAGTICGLNRLILLIPCHRVLKSDGSIGSYLYGPEIKESLLRHEQVL